MLLDSVSTHYSFGLLVVFYIPSQKSKGILRFETLW